MRDPNPPRKHVRYSPPRISSRERATGFKSRSRRLYDARDCIRETVEYIECIRRPVLPVIKSRTVSSPWPHNICSLREGSEPTTQTRRYSPPRISSRERATGSKSRSRCCYDARDCICETVEYKEWINKYETCDVIGQDGWHYALHFHRDVVGFGVGDTVGSCL